ncbi:MAG: hypothetical protein IJ149_07555 [Oscillospiraceae bacterium]|nr:hypothetical protein [Oscillospiraceae bacterium]
MKMKKTVAGVLAGAMAVSAMAAVVSADQDTISLTYDLKYYEEVVVPGKVTVKATLPVSTKNAYTFTNMKDSGDLYFELTRDDGMWAYNQGFDSATVSFGALDERDVTSPKAITPITVAADWGGATTFHMAYSTTTATPTTGAQFEPFNLKRLTTGTKEGTDYTFNSITITAVFKAASTVHEPTAETFAAALIGKSTLDVDNASWRYEWDSAVRATSMKIYHDWDSMSAEAPTYDTYLKNEKGFGGEASINGVAFASINPKDVSFAGGEKTEVIYPFRTQLNPSSYQTGAGATLRSNDVIFALSDRKSEGNRYNNPVAVINDAIANGKNVTFTFTAFSDYVVTTNSLLVKHEAGQPYIDGDKKYAVGAAIGYNATGYEWNNGTYTQHLYGTDNVTYTTPYGSVGEVQYSAYKAAGSYDYYGSYSSAWAVNLLTGGLTINNELTMQLNDTDKFMWGENTLTFDWDTITEDGKITNAKQFLTSMLLYTPTDWYWDNLQVTVVEGSEDVAAAEGLEDDGLELDDEEVIDEVEDIEEVEDVEEVVEDVEEPVVEEVVEEAAPVEVAPSPKTGNAPVALAVIPVALAAAAVVAKKRG